MGILCLVYLYKSFRSVANTFYVNIIQEDESQYKYTYEM